MRKELKAGKYFLESVWVNTSLWIKVEPTGKDSIHGYRATGTMITPNIPVVLPPVDRDESVADFGNLGNPELVHSFTQANGHPKARGEDKVLGILRVSTLGDLHTCPKACDTIVSHLSSRGMRCE